MSEFPLLFFPTASSVSRTKGKRKSIPQASKPSIERQSERLAPKFQQLQDSFNARTAEIQKTASGIDPEQTLVIETIGAVDGFINSVQKIPGFEWMGEFSQDGIVPDDDFYYADDANKNLYGRLYLVMSNSKALSQMLTLWKEYSENPNSMDFRAKEYRGLGGFKSVFEHLKDIRKWDVQDRLAEHGLFEYWDEELKSDPTRTVRFEAELWFRASQEKRDIASQTFSSLVNALGGTIVSQSIIPQICYHAFLGEIPAEAARTIQSMDDIALLECDDIMFFRPLGQIATGEQSCVEKNIPYEEVDDNTPFGDPIVALFDGLPVENHNLLAGRLQIDDPDGWAENYPVTQRYHGTSMASLIVHGDLSTPTAPLGTPLYVRPVLKPSIVGNESFPNNLLFVDFLHQAVRRLFVGQGDDTPIAANVKVINLSIGDSSRHFLHVMSPLAKLLDWLSVEYNVLFIVSAGNHAQPIELGISESVFEKLSTDDKETLVVEKIYADERNRKLLSPAESINALTIGACHNDASQCTTVARLVDVFGSALPSPVSAFGRGYRKSVKPDILFEGGKVLYRVQPSSNAKLSLVSSRQAPGNKVATPSENVGELNGTCFTCGTSNATALITRASAICYENIKALFVEQGLESELVTFGTSLTKAVLVHGCLWGEGGEQLMCALRKFIDPKKVKNYAQRWLGYGIPDISKITGCHEQRVTLLGFGSLKAEEAHSYKLPLPSSLGARREWRRLTVTLAWLSPIAPNTQKYRMGRLWFEVNEKELETQRQNADWQAVKNGTVQHEVFEGDRILAISSGDSLEIKVNCRADVGKITTSIAYGLVVSLEVKEGVDVPIYDEVRDQLIVEQPVSIRT